MFSMTLTARVSDPVDTLIVFRPSPHRTASGLRVPGVFLDCDVLVEMSCYSRLAYDPKMHLHNLPYCTFPYPK